MLQALSLIKTMKLETVLLAFVVSSESLSSFSFSLVPQPKLRLLRAAVLNDQGVLPRTDCCVAETWTDTRKSDKGDCVTDRRRALDLGLSSRRGLLRLGGSFLASAAVLAFPGENGRGSAAETSPKSSGMVEAATVADRLHLVPTFVIVDEKGVPYTVVGEDAKVTGYFFTTYGEASRILKVAIESAEQGRREDLSYLRLRRRQSKLPPLSAQEENDEVGPNPWINARISTVPLDFAVSLALKSQTSGSSKGKAYFQVAPAEVDIEDALALDKSGKKDLADGKVPLFYFEDFVRESNGEKQSPLYFRKSELIDDWKQLHPSTEVPEVLVSELFTVVAEMVKPGGTDEDLKQLFFCSPKESAEKAKECLQAGGEEAAFKLGQTIVVL